MTNTARLHASMLRFSAWMISINYPFMPAERSTLCKFLLWYRFNKVFPFIPRILAFCRKGVKLSGSAGLSRASSVILSIRYFLIKRITLLCECVWMYTPITLISAIFSCVGMKTAICLMSICKFIPIRLVKAPFKRDPTTVAPCLA